MGFSPQVNELVLTNSTTDVTVVTAPAASTIRMVSSITVYNADTVSATVELKIDVSATEKRLVSQILIAGESLVYEVKQNLDSTMKIEVVLAGAITTNQLECTAVYADYS